MGLLLVTGGLERSGYFGWVSLKLLRRVESERDLATLLVLLSPVLSTFMTNDAALFVIVPLTLSIGKRMKNDIRRLVVFEALAVNAGSSLTPIGNPQNLYIWHRWGRSFAEFTLQMAPLTALLTVLLLTFTLLLFHPNKKIELTVERGEGVDKKLLYTSTFLLLLLVLVSDLSTPYLPLLLILAVYTLLWGDVLRSADWYLIALFALVFLTFSSISHLPGVGGLISGSIKGKGELYAASILLSQAISNVPATIVLAQHTTSYRVLAYGVNVGGSGFFTASLANLIALKLYGERGFVREFLKWSVPYLLLSGVLVAVFI